MTGLQEQPPPAIVRPFHFSFSYKGPKPFGSRFCLSAPRFRLSENSWPPPEVCGSGHQHRTISHLLDIDVVELNQPSQ